MKREDSGHEGSYSLVGEYYAHEAIDGEILAPMQTGNVVIQDIGLVWGV